MTGSSIDGGIELLGKRLKLLKEVAPHVSRVAIVGPHAPSGAVYRDELRVLAERAGISLVEDHAASALDVAEYTPFRFVHPEQSGRGLRRRGTRQLYAP